MQDFNRAAMMRAAAAALIACAAGGGAAAQETTAFQEMPTGALLELYADVGDALRERGLLEAESSEAQLYAEHLIVVSMGDAAADLAVVGVRERQPGAARRGQVSIDSAALSSDGAMALVLFTFDFQIVRGATATASDVAALTTEGALVLDDGFWRAPGVQDVTARLFQAAQPAAQ